MAILFLDGFDHYTTTGQLDLKWDAASTISSFQAAEGRFGGGAARITSASQSLQKTVGGTATTIAVGGACRHDQLTANQVLWRLQEGSTTHVEITVDVAGAIFVERGTFTLIGTRSVPVIIANAYQFLEAKVFVSDTVGTVDVWVDGVNVLSLTGLDTKNGGTGFIDTVGFRGGNLNKHWDDCYILDDAGGAPQDDALGDLRIDNLMPDGDGNYTEFGTTTGTPHSGEVDEIPPDGDTTKVTSTGANERDTFTMANLAAITSQTIFGVQQFSFAQHDGGATNFRSKLRISAADFDGVSQAGGAAYGYFLEEWDDDPNAGPGAWVESVINGLESGVESL